MRSNQLILFLVTKKVSQKILPSFSICNEDIRIISFRNDICVSTNEKLDYQLKKNYHTRCKLFFICNFKTVTCIKIIYLDKNKK